MAYGAIAPPKLTESLPVFSYALPNDFKLSTHAVHGEASEEVMRYLYSVFEAEVQGAYRFAELSK
jgi:hypothetical protein